jgi:hypothetical protein
MNPGTEDTGGVYFLVAGRTVDDEYRLHAELYGRDGQFFARLDATQPSGFEVTIFSDFGGADVVVDADQLIATLKRAQEAIAD